MTRSGAVSPLQWRAAVTVAVTPAVGVLLLLLPRPIDGDDVLIVLVAMGGVVLVATAIVTLAAYRRPLPPPTLTEGYYRDRGFAATADEVRHGRPVDPPELQAAAIQLVPGQPRAAHLSLLAPPFSGASVALQSGDSRAFVVLDVVGTLLVGSGLAGLAQSRSVQHRLDVIEQAGRG